MTAPVIVWRASYESRHFTFEAYGATEEEARDAMLATLIAHGTEYNLTAVSDWVDHDDINTREYVLGWGYRDGQPIAPRS